MFVKNNEGTLKLESKEYSRGELGITGWLGETGYGGFLTWEELFSFKLQLY
jgi:hypothetical protein